MDAHLRAPDREALLDRVFHGSLVGMVVARVEDGVVLEANDAFGGLIGRSVGDLLGANLDDLGLWGELGPARARERLRATGLIDAYDTRVPVSDAKTGILRVSAEVVDVGEPLVVIRVSDVDGGVTAKARYLELRETELRYRAVVEQIPAITYTQVADPESPTGYRDVYISPQTLPLLGFTAEEWQADPTLWIQTTHPDDRDRVIGEDRESSREAKRFQSEYRMIAKDGRTRWFRDEAVFLHEPTSGLGVWQGVMLDITDEVEAREDRAAIEVRYRALVEQLPAVVYLAESGEDGDWHYVSPQIERVLGFTPEEWLDHPAPMRTFTRADDLPRVLEEEVRSLQTGEPFRAEYRMQRKDGSWVWILDEASIVRDERGSALLMQGLLYDITERKEAEERLVALDRLKDTLLHTLSNDLKEPLTVILGAASTLERLDDELDAADRAHLLRTLIERTKGVSELLTDLLDLDRLGRGIIEPRRYPLDLDRTVRDVVARSDVLQTHQLEIDSERCLASLDVAKVERMIENLLANAAHHTGKGSCVWVRVWSDDAGATVAVEDDGPGVPDDLKEQIFEPFRRGPNPTQPGSGIGLSLVARFAELHGGRAWVEDREGGGSSFRVFFPAVD